MNFNSFYAMKSLCFPVSIIICTSWLLLRGGIIQSVPYNCDHFLIYCAHHLSSNNSRFMHQNSLLWLQQRYLVAKRRETGREMAAEFCSSISLSCLKGYLTWHEVDGFNYPPKEVVLKNPSLSAGYESEKLGLSGKYDNHYTTDNNPT
jgi:hypothetical protein